MKLCNSELSKIFNDCLDNPLPPFEMEGLKTLDFWSVTDYLCYHNLVISCRSEPTAVLPKMPESTITSPEDSEASLSLICRWRSRRRAAKSALVVSSPVVLEDPTPVVSSPVVLEDPTQWSWSCGPELGSRAHSSPWVHSRARSSSGVHSWARSSPPKVVAYVAEPPKAAVSASAPLWAVTPTPEVPVCPVTAKETVELSACPVLVKKTIAELSVHSVAAVEAVIKHFVLFFAVMIVSFGGLLVMLVTLRWLLASPLLPALPGPPWPPALPALPWPTALPAPSWHSALPLSLIPLPLHGPGPPSLPLIHLRFTSLLNFLDFLWSVWKLLFRGRVMSQSVVGVPSSATRGHSLWVIVCLCSGLHLPSPFAFIIGSLLPAVYHWLISLTLHIPCSFCL